MKRIRKDIEISDLIYKSLRGETSKSEDELLEAWCLEPRNRKLFMELREADHLYEGVADMYNVDTKVPFKNVDDRIRKKKRVRLMKYVSGVAAVLLVGVVLWGNIFNIMLLIKCLFIFVAVFRLLFGKKQG